MKPGVANGRFLGDLHTGVSDAVMRKRWAKGDYGTAGEQPRADFVKGWRKLAGRSA